MSEPLLAAHDLEKEYRIGPEVVRVLRGVTLTVNAGESVAVIGASGVGKSSLLHILGTLDRPTGGRVLFSGEDVFARSDAGLARLRRTEVGFVFQFYNLLGEMTALENAMLPALLQRLTAVDAMERATAALKSRPRRPHGPPAGRAIGASNSAWRSRGLWSAARVSSSPMSRPGTWTPRPAK
jgi:lipoprotein-releasing system ATP-binding protein